MVLFGTFLVLCVVSGVVVVGVLRILFFVVKEYVLVILLDRRLVVARSVILEVNLVVDSLL